MSYYPGQGYSGGGGSSSGYSQPPPGPPPQGLDIYGYRQQQSQAPSHPPPPGLDIYGYPLGGQSTRAFGPPHEIPQGAQQFGQGAPEGYQFQYSNCSGARKALLIGINYFGKKGELRGCINDTRNVSAFLIERYNYRREDMIILTDDARDPNLIPTKANIIRAMQWLVAGARPNDALFLHYSGRPPTPVSLSFPSASFVD